MTKRRSDLQANRLLLVPTFALCLVLAWFGWIAVKTWCADSYLDAVNADQDISSTEALDLLTKAQRFRPDDSTIWMLEASYLAPTAPEKAKQKLLTSLALRQTDWHAWQQLGLIAIQLNDQPGALAAFRTAARYDQGFVSHYEIANMYALLGDKDGIWPELKKAMQLTTPEHVPEVLQFAEGVAQIPPIDLPSLLPASQPQVILQSLEYFIGKQQFDAANAAWHQLNCSYHDVDPCFTGSRDLIVQLLNSAKLKPPQEMKRYVGMAVDIWNAAVNKSVLKAPHLLSGRLVDGNFQYSWDNPPFIWQDNHAIYLERLAGQPGIQGDVVEGHFSGQFDEALLFQQIVPVEEGKSYNISYLSRRMGSSSGSGLELTVRDSEGDDLVDLPAQLSSGWQLNSASFKAPKGVYMITVAFRYQRPLGQVSFEGTVALAQANMTEVQR